MFLADGGTNIKKLLEPVDEPLMPGMEWYGTAKDIGVHEMWQIQVERTELCKAYLDRWNECEGLDALLLPTTPYASVQHDQFKYVGYTGIFNILDYPALSFPTGIKADAILDAKDSTQIALSEFCKPVQESCKQTEVTL